MYQELNIGDKVTRDGEIHTIKEIEVHQRPIGWHAIVKFEDGGCGLVDSCGYTDLIKLKENGTE